MFRHMTEYYNLYENKGLAGVPVEPFTGDFTNDKPALSSMTATISSTDNLYETRKGMIADANADFSSKVNDPNGHGYIAPLPEVKKNDALQILQQEQSILSIGAIAGVSLIVFGILISSSTK
jgi:hypothetical protein